MNQLLFTLICSEMAVLLTLSFRNPIREFLMTELDALKQQVKCKVMVRTIHMAVLATFFSSIYSILKIRHRLVDGDLGNTIDQVLMAEKLVIASLTGFFLFLSMVIDILHKTIRECNLVEKIRIADEKQLAERKIQMAFSIKASNQEIATLESKIKKLESEMEKTAKKAEAAQGNVLALRNQSEWFQVEYDRLLEYNQTLVNQLGSIDQLLLEDGQETRRVSLKSGALNCGIVQCSWGSETSNDGREEGFVNESHQSHFTCSYEKSSPRHRRPIYQN